MCNDCAGLKTMADESEKSYEWRWLWWAPTSTQPASLLDRERTSIHCSPGDPLPMLTFEWANSCELMLLNSCVKSPMLKCAFIAGMSMVVVVIMLKGMDMVDIMAGLMPKSTGEVCSWAPNVESKVVAMPMAPGVM